MFGSGQWTIFEGYAATKLMRAGFRSNNLDPNARHCMASAAVRLHAHLRHGRADGLLRRFRSTPTPSCCGARTWPRCIRSCGRGVADRRLGDPHVKVAVLSTFTHRSMDLADIPIIFKPGTDLAILNYIANHIIKTRPGQQGVRRRPHDLHARRDRHRLRPAARRSAARPGGQGRGRRRPRWSRSTSRRSRPSSREYTLEKVVGADRRRARAFSRSSPSSMPIPSRKVMSLWTMGFNQHVRGVWANQLVYNIHLLTGKISEPGNSPFSLTGQPSACGTAREVGTFAHRLPADMVVTNPEHRKHAEEIWKLPHGMIPEKPGYHAVAAGPHAARTASSISTGCRSTTTCRPRRTPATRPIPATAIPTISSSSRTPIRR